MAHVVCADRDEVGLGLVTRPASRELWCRSEDRDFRSLAVVDQCKIELMKCANCERVVARTRTRCPACQTKLPAWYLIAAVVALVAIYAAYRLVEIVL